MVESILSHPWFVNFILPFLLVFTLVFAILEKTKLLGDEKRQIDAIVAAVIGLIFISFFNATQMIVTLVPFFGVCLFIIFIFMLIYGFISGNKTGDVLNPGLKITIAIVFGFALVIAVLLITGLWDFLYGWVMQRDLAKTFLINALLLAIIGGAIAIVLSSGGNKEGGK